MTAAAPPAPARSWSSMLYGAPWKESGRSIRKRMADLVTRRVTGGGSITHEELLGGGFSQIEIDTHYRAALELSGVKRLGTTI
jgi:hypothetical protein